MVTNIQWEDGAKKSGELYIADEPGKTWTLKRLHMPKLQILRIFLSSK